jgi:hypothetical protein
MMLSRGNLKRSFGYINMGHGAFQNLDIPKHETLPVAIAMPMFLIKVCM